MKCDYIRNRNIQDHIRKLYELLEKGNEDKLIQYFESKKNL